MAILKALFCALTLFLRKGLCSFDILKSEFQLCTLNVHLPDVYSIRFKSVLIKPFAEEEPGS